MLLPYEFYGSDMKRICFFIFASCKLLRQNLTEVSCETKMPHNIEMSLKQHYKIWFKKKDLNKKV